MNPFAPVIRESIFLQTLPDRHAVDAKAALPQCGGLGYCADLPPHGALTLGDACASDSSQIAGMRGFPQHQPGRLTGNLPAHPGGKLSDASGHHSAGGTPPEGSAEPHTRAPHTAYSGSAPARKAGKRFGRGGI